MGLWHTRGQVRDSESEDGMLTASSRGASAFDDTRSQASVSEAWGRAILELELGDAVCESYNYSSFCAPFLYKTEESQPQYDSKRVAKTSVATRSSRGNRLCAQFARCGARQRGVPRITAVQDLRAAPRAFLRNPFSRLPRSHHGVERKALLEREALRHW